MFGKTKELLKRICELEKDVELLNDYILKNLNVTVGYEEKVEEYNPICLHLSKRRVPVTLSIKEFIEQLIKDDIVSVEIIPEKKEERKINIKYKKD